MNPDYPFCGCCKSDPAVPIIELSKSELHRLLSGETKSIQIGNVGEVRVKAERPQRTGHGPTFVGPVLAVFSRYGARYAFHTDIAVAQGDTVDVETRNGTQEAKIVAEGTGGFRGPLKSIVAVKAVRR